MSKKIKPVFEDLGFTKSESLAMSFKVDLYLNIIKIIKQRDHKSKDLQKILDVPHSRISELMNARLSIVSIEKLIDYLEKLGCTATLTVKSSKAS